MAVNELSIIALIQSGLEGGVGYSHIKAVWVCAAVKGMVFKVWERV